MNANNETNNNEVEMVTLYNVDGHTTISYDTAVEWQHNSINEIEVSEVSEKGFQLMDEYGIVYR